MDPGATVLNIETIGTGTGATGAMSETTGTGRGAIVPSSIPIGENKIFIGICLPPIRTNSIQVVAIVCKTSVARNGIGII